MTVVQLKIKAILNYRYGLFNGYLELTIRPVDYWDFTYKSKMIDNEERLRLIIEHTENG